MISVYRKSNTQNLRSLKVESFLKVEVLKDKISHKGGFYWEKVKVRVKENLKDTPRERLKFLVSAFQKRNYYACEQKLYLLKFISHQSF